MAKTPKKKAAKKPGKVAKFPDAAARKKRAPKVPKKPRQAALPGLEEHGIAEIERAAFDYVDARDERMRLGEVESKRHVKLLAVMKKNGKKVYRHRTGTEIIEVAITAKDPEEKAKVKIAPATADNIDKAAAGKKTKRERKKKDVVETPIEETSAPGTDDQQLDIDGDGEGEAGFE